MLQIHQAYFGAVNGTSHGQLASSLGDKNLRSFLAGFTDRPGVPPAGYTLQPYLAATSFENYYLICRTWPDVAVERQGMVFTHVLMLPIQQLAEAPALGPVLDLLLNAPPSLAERPTTLNPFTLSASDSKLPESASEVPASWLVITKHLVDSSELTPVYAFSDAVHFQALLEALWHGLPVSLRARLSWGIRFTPPGSRDVTPLLVYVPAELEVKWRGKGVIQLDTDEMKTPELPIDQLLFGNEQGSNFRDFVAAIEVGPQSFEALKRCQRAFQQYKNLLTATADVGELLALVRTLRQLQPDPGKAIDIKRQSIKALTEALLTDGATEAMALRAVPMESFQTGAEQLGKAVGVVIERAVTAANSDPTLQGNLLQYLAEANPAIIESWWHEAAATAFTQTLSAGSEAAAKVIWLGLAGNPNVRAYVLETVPDTAAWEQVLSQTVPASLSTVTADVVTTFSVRRNWWDLFAAAVGAAYAPAEAVRKQVKAENGLHLSTSTRVSKLAKKVADSDLVELAVELRSKQLQELAGDACGRNPKLLALIDASQQSWRAIWSVSLSYTKSLTAGLSKPKETIDVFLTEVSTGRANDTQILELIAASTFANVLHLPERSNLWDKLPTRLQSKFIVATLDELVEEILANSWEGDIEPVLVKRAQSIEFIGKFLREKRNDPAAVLSVNTLLQNLTDAYLKDYINNLISINGIVAVQLGQLVAVQGWNLSARSILEKARYNTDFLPALNECAGMFGFIDKLIHSKLFGHQVTKADAWSAFEETMAHLYEEGPDKDNIWKRAGGDVTKLTNAQSRRAQWTAAIGLLRYGGGGKKISAESLIRAALDDYKNNSNLQALAGLQHLFKS
ncbi:effector-associated domain EAD1-containing protein [Hymenobacter sp. BRD67]|uniref:GAP1-N1 domain-containing protein n=1 Tax=Hymenobacter sp. BRD67 TaxID=2675877 RepID=UPI001566CA64|nr:effector-associated domain EAD1-containing protein [Hymenobacter sp. BRD67]QKG51826.1 hypothetical protein GKZ67_03420 [Hymenobacter sp. BRD67]